ncbi:MAG: Rrf2 family transcriptional regulator [Phycisphaeraceae bacterium]|nr:Rrf2 family transcriptional regulator [Phycisphaeraceae bacterium]
MYGKQTERAIAAMSRLAEVWDGGLTRLSASDIAENRGLPGPMVAKLLTALSQHGLVRGSPGPGGGYALARPPVEITLQEVWTIFERPDHSPNCPFGGGVCGVGDPCALHDRLVQMNDSVRSMLRNTTFQIFLDAKLEGRQPAPRTMKPDGERESYRAPQARHRSE